MTVTEYHEYYYYSGETVYHFNYYGYEYEDPICGKSSHWKKVYDDYGRERTILDGHFILRRLIVIQMK